MEYENTIIGICIPPEVVVPLIPIITMVIAEAAKIQIIIACIGVLNIKIKLL
jgi:hypothetical protein